MSQNDDPTRDPPREPTPEPTPDVPPAPIEPPAPAPVLKTRWRDRVFHLRAMVAVGLAGLVLGAGAGAGTALVAGHDDRPDFRHQRMGGPGERGFPGWGGRGGQDGPPNMGQVPPGSSEQQDDSSGGTSQAPSSS